MLAVWTLWRRELVRFYRQPNRIVGAIGSPLLFWLFIGMGLKGTFRTAEGMGYLEYFLPGTIILTVLFTAIFSTISIIEDRREGFLQSVLVAPVSRGGVVLGKILGGTTVAMLQGLLMVLLVPLVAPWPGPAAAGVALLGLFLTSFALTCLGFIIAWRMDSTQGFHAIMNLFLIPMWLLSGALFPLDSAPAWLQWTMRVNPLTYGVTALRHSIYGVGDVALPLGVSAGFGMVLFLLATLSATRTPKAW
jgi:ABC-2 type transport system permease protein